MDIADDLFLRKIGRISRNRWNATEIKAMRILRRSAEILTMDGNHQQKLLWEIMTRLLERRSESETHGAARGERENREEGAWNITDLLSDEGMEPRHSRGVLAVGSLRSTRQSE